jgi:hypothetical protein
MLQVAPPGTVEQAPSCEKSPGLLVGDPLPTASAPLSETALEFGLVTWTAPVTEAPTGVWPNETPSESNGASTGPPGAPGASPPLAGASR